METDNFNFCVTDEGKAPTRRGILSVVSSMCDPSGLLRLSFCNPRAYSRPYAGKSMAGTKRFCQILLYGSDGWKSLHVWEQIRFQMFQGTWISYSHQRPVTSFIGCIKRWLRNSMVPKDCQRQRCPALFVCSRQNLRNSPENGVHTAPRVGSSSGRCEIELPDSKWIRVSQTW